MFGHGMGIRLYVLFNTIIKFRFRQLRTGRISNKLQFRLFNEQFQRENVHFRIFRCRVALTIHNNNVQLYEYNLYRDYNA